MDENGPGRGLSVGHRDLHCVFGSRSQDLEADLGPELGRLMTEDGHIDLPCMDTLLSTDRFWAVAFPGIYERVARMICGASYPTLHRVHEAPLSDTLFMTNADAEGDERNEYLCWITQGSRVQALGKTLRESLNGTAWSGQLRDFEQLLRRLILRPDDTRIDQLRVAQHCAPLSQPTPHHADNSPRMPTWLSGLTSPLKPLPLATEKLPDVIAAVERQYFREAARQAARACAPKPAKMQDIARILGIPRQTAARKWQMHGLSSALLAGASEDAVAVQPHGSSPF